MARGSRKTSKRIEEWFQRYEPSNSSPRTESRSKYHLYHYKKSKYKDMEHSPLHEACRVGDLSELDRLLSDKQTCALHPNSAGHIPLHVSVLHRQVSCIKRLLQEVNARIQLHYVDQRGRTALHLALERRPIDDNCVASLLSCAPLYLCTQVIDHDGNTVMALDLLHRGGIYEAIAAGNVERLAFLVTQYNIELHEIMTITKRTMLHEGCEACQANVVSYLLSNCLAPQDRDSSGATSLHVCARRGFLEGCILLLDRVLDVDSILLCQDECGRTALHWALLRCHVVVATYIIERAWSEGCSIELLQLCDAAGYSPLHTAAATGQTQLAMLLLERGADVNLNSAVIDQTPLPRNPKRSKMNCKRDSSRLRSAVNRLSEVMCSTSMMDLAQQTVELRTLRLWILPSSSMEDSRQCVEEGRDRQVLVVPILSPLEVALRGNYIDVANVLVQMGADVSISSLWRMYVANHALHSILEPYAIQWLDPIHFPNDCFANLCNEPQLWGEEGLCRLLSIAIVHNLQWTNLQGAVVSALRHSRLQLASLLVTNSLVQLEPSIWFVLAQHDAPFTIWTWLHECGCQVDDVAHLIELLMSSPKCNRNLRQIQQAELRTTVCLWLCEHYIPTGVNMQRIIDVAIRQGYRTLYSQLLSTTTSTLSVHVPTILLHQSELLLALPLQHKWIGCDEGITVACHLNLSLPIMRSLIQKSGRPNNEFRIRGKCAINWALWYRRFDLVRVLHILMGPTIFLCHDSQGRDALYYAGRTKNATIVQYVWDQTPDAKSQFNVLAALAGAIEIHATDVTAFLLKLVSSSLDIETKRHLVHLACSRGFRELATLIAPIDSWHDLVLHDVNPNDTLRSFGLFDHGKNPASVDFSTGVFGLYRHLLSLPAQNSETIHWRYLPRNERYTIKLFTACQLNSVAQVQALVTQGISVTELIQDKTALSWAAVSGATNVVKWLLQQNISVDQSSLYLAAQRRHLEVVKLLVEAALTQEVQLGRLNGDGVDLTLLHWAARMPHDIYLFDTLLGQPDSDIDVVDGYGFTPIAHALVCCQLQNVLYLVERGARLEAEYEGQSSFYYILHLLPSDIWRILFQAFLQQKIHGRSLHCSADQMCGCKSYEGGDTTCLFCSHSFELHSHVPFPPWYRDVCDTYRRMDPSSPKSLCSDPFHFDQSDDEDSCSKVVATPDHDLKATNDEVGRLSRGQLLAICKHRFATVVQRFDLHFPEIYDNGIEDDEPPMNFTFEGWQLFSPILLNGDNQPHTKSISTTLSGGGCWCSISNNQSDSIAVLRRAITQWQSTRNSFPHTVQGTFCHWRRVVALNSIAPMCSRNLVRLKLFLLHWQQAKVVDSFTRWKRSRLLK